VNFSIPDYVLGTVESNIVPKEDDEKVAYYGNITGIVRGKWYRIAEPNSNPFLPPELPDESVKGNSVELAAPPGWGNMTYQNTIKGNVGKFALELSELNKNSTIQFMEASMDVGDVGGGGMYRTKLQGVHFPLTGQAILVSTTPQKYGNKSILLISDSRA
jgi:hypothetical protein